MATVEEHKSPSRKTKPKAGHGPVKGLKPEPTATKARKPRVTPHKTARRGETTMNTTTETKKNGTHTNSNHGTMDAAASVLRDKFAGAVHQLDDVWDTMSKVERKARSHPRTLIAAGSAMLLAIAGGVTLGILENQRRNTFAYKLSKSLKWAKGML
jgi:hypothetical protein